MDFAGPLIRISCGAKYVLVMVENFSKWIELVVLPQNSSELVANVILNRVSVRFGTHVEVLTGQERVFFGSFEDLCTKALIDHHTTYEIIQMQMVWPNMLSKWSNKHYVNMVYFEATIVIWTLCSHG